MTLYIAVKNPVRKRDIVDGLRKLGLSAGEALFVHSSLSAFGRVDGGAEAVCDALVEAVGPEGTAVVPTFTWGANHEKEIVEFDVRSARAETGLIPETFRKLPNALRSDHVCHSVAAVGPRAAEMMGDGIHPFGKGSSMYQLYELNAWVLFMGCTFASCTALQRVEELMQVPYRYYRHFQGSTVIRAEGTRVPSNALEFIRYLPYRVDFEKMEGVLDGMGLLRRARVGSATVIAARARSIIDRGMQLLGEDIGFLLTPASQAHLANVR